MTNNDILRRLRYALDIDNISLIKIFRLSGYEIDQNTVLNLLKKEGEGGYLNMEADLLGLFLDGLILFRRGPRSTGEFSAAKSDAELTNNDILKKIRIALELKEDDLLEIMKNADVEISKSELNALFRRKGQKNFKACGDQFLRQLLQGLTIRLRGSGAGGA